MDAVDHVAFLAGSEQRVAVLEALADGDRPTKDELVDRCGAARVTVNRNLEKLSERGLAAATGDGWRLTPLGELLVEEFLELVEAAGTAADLAPVLRRLPADGFDLDPGKLAGAEVTTATPANPYAPAERQNETVRAADSARMVLPAIRPGQSADVAERVAAGALDLELVTSPSVARTLREESPDALEAFEDSEGATVVAYEEGVPYYLGLVDGTAQIGVAGEGGVPRALAESDDPAVVAWAAAAVDDYRDAAVPLESNTP